MVDATTNAAIAGAFVHLSTPGMTTTTDASGAFTFLNVPSGQHTLVTTAFGFQSDTRSIVVPSQVPVRIALCPVASPICGSSGPAVAASVGRLF